MRDLFIILSWFLAESCSVKISQAFHNPSINFHSDVWRDVSQFFLLDLFLILSFLPELTVKQGESSQSKTGQNSWLPALIDSTETLILKDNTLVSGESLSRESFKKNWKYAHGSLNFSRDFSSLLHIMQQQRSKTVHYLTKLHL